MTTAPRWNAIGKEPARRPGGRASTIQPLRPIRSLAARSPDISPRISKKDGLSAWISRSSSFRLLPLAPRTTRLGSGFHDLQLRSSGASTFPDTPFVVVENRCFHMNSRSASGNRSLRVNSQYHTDQVIAAASSRANSAISRASRLLLRDLKSR